MNRPRILVIGSGGREHALAWRIARDSTQPELFIAPGNPGTARLGTNLPIPATDCAALVAWAARHRPDLVVVGPEAPLCDGLVDALECEGILAFGPRADAARLEGSKIFSKEVMQAAGIPTARSARFSDAAAARSYVSTASMPIVVKADGLAAGKGVTICASAEQAVEAIDDALVRGVFGQAGREVLIEEFLAGEEVSILALVDGRIAIPLASAQDHKRVGEGDAGPNTGGMGAYSPAPIATDAVLVDVQKRVFEPMLAELNRRGIVFRGVLYAGLMLTAQGPRVLEFNVRFGDPETQVILPRWEGDLLPALTACAKGQLDPSMVRWTPGASACVVLAAGGYPGTYQKGQIIRGLDEASTAPGVVVFHAGTHEQDGQIRTSGGRVLTVTGTGPDLPAALQNAYRAIGSIRFEGMHFRRDIGWRALQSKR